MINMTIIELIVKLEELKNLYGNLEVVCGYEDLNGPFLFGSREVDPHLVKPKEGYLRNNRNVICM